MYAQPSTSMSWSSDKAFTGTPEDRQKAIRSLQNLIAAEQRAIYADEYLDAESALDTIMGNVPPSPDDG